MATVDDITGKQAAVAIRPDARQSGSRLSKRGKILAFGTVSGIVTLTVVGIMAARHIETSGGGEDAGIQVGTVQPPAPPAILPTQPGALATSVAGNQGAVTGGTASIPLGSGPAVANKLTPAQKYQQWLEEQHYKDLEGAVLAANAAVAAPLPIKGENGMGQAGQTAAGTTATNPMSYLDAALAAAKGGQGLPGAVTSPNGGGGSALPATDSPAAQAGNEAFMESQKKAMDENGYLDRNLQKPVSRHEITAGSIIPAVMVTGINSDLPGTIVAQVRQTVYNSLDPNEVLIPQGTKLIGSYSSQVAYGQSRVLVAWARLIFPNGETIALQGMPGTDGTGEAGFHDLVDNHYWKIFGSAILISLLGVGAQLSQPQNSNALTSPSAGQQAAAAMAQQLDSVGTNVLNKNLDIQPTLKIRPGYLFNVLVTRTMILPSYPGTAQ